MFLKDKNLLYSYSKDPPNSYFEESLEKSRLYDILSEDEESYDNGIKKGYDLLVDEVSNDLTINKLKTIKHLDSQKYVRNSWTGIGINTKRPLLDSKEFRIILDEAHNIKGRITKWA